MLHAAPPGQDSHSYLHTTSSERSDIHRERHDSLDRVEPSFPMAVETFRLVGELIGLYVEFKESMKDLDKEQTGKSDLEKIQYLLSLMGGYPLHLRHPGCRLMASFCSPGLNS